MLPELSVRTKFYTKLAEGLTDHEINTVVVEQRGNSESSYRPGDGNAFGLRDYLDTDIATAATWVQTNFPDAPVYIGEHSPGGHMAALA